MVSRSNLSRRLDALESADAADRCIGVNLIRAILEGTHEELVDLAARLPPDRPGDKPSLASVVRQIVADGDDDTPDPGTHVGKSR